MAILGQPPKGIRHMKNEQNPVDAPCELGDDDRDHIRTIFHEEVVPKLIKFGARLGNLSCEFAGEEYKNWTIQFRSAGSDFEIVEFEYDDEAEGLSLDL
jgi:hypothetical protein